jgi:hypothetical protein
MMWEQTASFWQERDAWAASRIATQQGKRLRADVDLARQLARWSIKAGRYMQHANAGLARAVITPDPKAEGAVAELIERIAPALAGAFDEHLAPAMRRAFDQWPVRSGLSKSLLNLGFQAGDEVLIAKMQSLAPYTVYIKGSPQIRLIRRPGIEAGRAAVQSALARVAA